MQRLRCYVTKYLAGLMIFIAFSVSAFCAQASETESVLLARTDYAVAVKVPEQAGAQLNRDVTVEDVLTVRGLPLEWHENVSTGNQILLYLTPVGGVRYFFEGGKLAGEASFLGVGR